MRLFSTNAKINPLSYQLFVYETRQSFFGRSKNFLDAPLRPRGFVHQTKLCEALDEPPLMTNKSKSLVAYKR